VSGRNGRGGGYSGPSSFRLIFSVVPYHGHLQMHFTEVVMNEKREDAGREVDGRERRSQ